MNLFWILWIIIVFGYIIYNQAIAFAALMNKAKGKQAVQVLFNVVLIAFTAWFILYTLINPMEVPNENCCDNPCSYCSDYLFVR